MRKLLEHVLSGIWGSDPQPKWINVDIISNKIGSEILSTRVENTDEEKLRPIILYGFRSFQSLLLSEKHYPRLLVSPGIYYLQLPATLSKVKIIFQRARSFKPDQNKLAKNLLEHNYSGMELSQVESKLAHHYGNFLGAEKLLYGAHLSCMITAKQYVDILKKINDSQGDFLKQRSINTPEYLLYQLAQSNYREDKNIRVNQNNFLKARVLYIDDHAKLGWGAAVASALFGNTQIKSYPVNAKFSEFIHGQQYETSQECCLRTLSITERSKENEYVESLKCLLNYSFVTQFDLILLDLRLRWQKDEQDIDGKISGFEVLAEIRKANAAIPIVMLTASRKAKNMEKVVEMGADAYFIKEAPAPSEKPDRIRAYCRRFRETAEEALKKSYLAEAWRLIEILAGKSANNCLGFACGPENLDEKFRIDWENDVISPLIKAVGLIKKRGAEADEKYFSWNTLGEAMINLEKPNDCIQQKNTEYKQRKTGTLYRYLSQDFKPQFLLKGLRSIYAHGRSGDAEAQHEDAKIALYLSLRLFFEPDKLDRLLSMMWEDAQLINLETYHFTKAREKILKLYQLQKGSTVTQGRWSITYCEDGSVCSFDGEKRNRSKNSLPYPLLHSSSALNPFFKRHDNDKEYHYLLFLSSHSIRFNKLDSQDQRVLGKAYELCCN